MMYGSYISINYHRHCITTHRLYTIIITIISQLPSCQTQPNTAKHSQTHGGYTFPSPPPPRLFPAPPSCSPPKFTFILSNTPTIASDICGTGCSPAADSARCILLTSSSLFDRLHARIESCFEEGRKEGRKEEGKRYTSILVVL